MTSIANRIQTGVERMELQATEFLAELTAPYKGLVIGPADQLESVGDLGGAAEIYREGLELFPDEVDFLVNLGAVLKELGGFDESEETVLRAIK